MPRGNRIKEFTFNPTLTAANLQKTYSDYPINGEILAIYFKNTDVDDGSVWVAKSGTDQEIWRANDTSGTTADGEAYPQIFPVDTTGAAISGTGGNGVPVVSNHPLYVAGSALGSGNSFNLTVLYR